MKLHALPLLVLLACCTAHERRPRSISDREICLANDFSHDALLALPRFPKAALRERQAAGASLVALTLALGIATVFV